MATPTGQFVTGDPFIAANGKVGWIYARHGEQCFPLPDLCITASSAVAILPNGNRTFNAGPQPRGSMDISTQGRFLVIDKSTVPFDPSGTPGGPVKLIDWVTGTVETLQAPTLTSSGQISDDQRLVATTITNGGWYEFAAAPT